MNAIHNLISLGILFCLFFVGNGQSLRRRRPLPRLGNAKSVIMHYPNDVFDPKYDWRNNLAYSQALRDESDLPVKEYVTIARAQDMEDVYAYENWFYGLEGGIILESGALNGVYFSTSFMFETFANWQAIHVEADPRNFAGLVKNRPHGINIHAALCSEPMSLHYTNDAGTAVQGFVEFMAPDFLRKWHGKLFRNASLIDELPVVQCLPLKSVLKQMGVHRIDLWILDTEGSELSVLQGVDFNAVAISTIIMECDQHDPTKNEQKLALLNSNGFQCELFMRNCMCTHREFVPTAAPVKTEIVIDAGVRKKWPFRN